jgi:hypothetical protein
MQVGFSFNQIGFNQGSMAQSFSQRKKLFAKLTPGATI